MRELLDSFWRAAAYCLHPRVIALSVLPLILLVAAALGLGYFFWDAAVDAVRTTLESWTLVDTLMRWLEGIGLGKLRAALAPLVVVFIATPVLVIAVLLCVALLMTPSMLSLVAERRFPQLERKHGGSLLAGTFAALFATLVALVALLVSMPLWFVPPLILILPPLIWGWLTYRVLSYDVLAEHASRDERRALVKEHRVPLLAMGVLTGYLGAAPGLVWASGVMMAVLAPVLVPVAIFVYTLVFAFSALWFAHYCLAALQAMRAVPAPLPMTPLAPPPPSAGTFTTELLPPP